MTERLHLKIYKLQTKVVIHIHFTYCLCDTYLYTASLCVGMCINVSVLPLPIFEVQMAYRNIMK